MSLRRANLGQGSFSVAAALLLVLFSYTTAVLGPTGPFHRVEGGLAGFGLADVEEEVRAVLSEALDEALPRAMEAAAREERVDLASALDATMVSRVTCRFPLEVCGWRVELLEASARMQAVWGPGELCGGTLAQTAPEARARVVVDGPTMARAGPVILEVTAVGAPGRAGPTVARAATVLHALTDPSGPVAYEARCRLWELSQGGALTGVRRPAALVTAEGVGAALASAIARTASGAVPPAPTVPPIDVVELVRQAVEGAVESSLLWLDDYLLLGDGMKGMLSRAGMDQGTIAVLGALEAIWKVEAALREGASAAVIAIVETVLGELPRPGVGGTLSRNLEAAKACLDDLSERSEVVSRAADATGPMARELAREVVDGLLGVLDEAGPLGGGARDLLERMANGILEGGGAGTGLVEHLVGALSAASVAVARLGIACAEDALLAIGSVGAQVELGDAPRDDDVPAPEPVRLETRVHGLAVDTSWSGTVDCEPRSLLSAGRALMTAEGRCGSLPYTASCAVSVSGTAEVSARVPGAAGHQLVAEWEAPIDLVLEVPVVTGWALDGVAYAPSSNAFSDLSGAGRALWEGFTDAAMWLVQRVRDAAEWVLSQVTWLVEELVENVLEESAYILSRYLWNIGESLVRRELNEALNGSWDLLVHLIGDEVRERLTWELDVAGCTVRVGLDPMLQQLVLVTARGGVTVELTVRRLCDPHPPFRAMPIEGYYWGVLGRAELDLGGRGAVVNIDPLTLVHPSVLTMASRWGGDGEEPTTELRLEALEARRVSDRHGVRLSDVAAGVGLLSLPGLGPVVDAGLVLHGDGADLEAAIEVVTKAVKDAWFASVSGRRTGELLEALGSAPDAGLFLEKLFRELHHSLVTRSERLASELEAFVEVDPPNPSWPTVRLSLVLSRPLELLLPLQAWVARALVDLMGSGTSGRLGEAARGLAAAVAERVQVRAELVWGVDLPRWLTGGGEAGAPPEVGLVVRSQANLAALVALAGRDWGVWEATLEVLLRGVPGAVLAVVPGMGSPDWRWAEVVLARATLLDISAPRVRLSQVLYDASGRDSDLEFVELVNADGRIVDLGGFTLEDGSGSFTLRGHLPLLPGEHMLVARNATATREMWGLPPDVWGMGLALANDGDEVRLVAPDGRCMDQVAWEGRLPGWEAVEATEGLALIRRSGDLRGSEPMAWTVDVPSPRRSGWW